MIDMMADIEVKIQGTAMMTFIIIIVMKIDTGLGTIRIKITQDIKVMEEGESMMIIPNGVMKIQEDILNPKVVFMTDMKRIGIVITIQVEVPLTEEGEDHCEEASMDLQGEVFGLVMPPCTMKGIQMPTT